MGHRYIFRIRLGGKHSHRSHRPPSLHGKFPPARNGHRSDGAQGGDVIIERLKKGKPYSIVVVAEGIPTLHGKKAAQFMAEEIEYETGFETRETVLGYIQRGGSPTAFDRTLATRMGGHATELIAQGKFGRMVSLQGDDIVSVPLAEVAGKVKLVTPDNDLIVQGRRMGVCFG